MNRNRRGLLVLALAMTAGCGGAPRLGKLTPGDVILAFGDSLTYGTGATEEESYPAVLAGLLGRSVVRAGVPGEMTAQGLVRLPVALEQHGPRLVLLCLGGNDMLRKVPDATIRQNLHAMLKLLKERGTDVVLIGVPRPALITSAPAFYEELAAEFDVPYEGKVVTSVLYSAELKSDPIHPNAAGYRKMADAIAALLKSSGAL